MHLVMFDIDGTLIDSSDFEGVCYSEAVQEVMNCPFNTDWSTYSHVSDSGIIEEIIDMNGLHEDRDSIHHEVKSSFIKRIKSHLHHMSVKEIKGASNFIQLLRARNDIELAIATGGWEETAKIKLASAGIDYAGIAFASGSDHLSRTNIMQLAEARCSTNEFVSKSYFGDAIWDKKASQELAYNFILVGNRFNHSKQIQDFSLYDKTLKLMGL